MGIQLITRVNYPDEFKKMVETDLKSLPDYKEACLLVERGDLQLLEILREGEKSSNPLTSLSCSGLRIWLECERELWERRAISSKQH